ncbi:class E sortase [uncultured Methanobrevibacter sp.]|uniref:class E sortase n=1 Tax=uncultured Methanobrevibacter sp. TaxID=253161 RepID=UPI0025E4E568|nr:class E sortase [uncultured Methanobrevibacter sp.]
MKTTIIIIALLVIGLYAATETTYYANKITVENNIVSPVIIIEKIGVNEKINNNSPDQGVYYDNKHSFTPTKGDILIFGHRTLLGSPFLRLNQLKNGDIITLEWPNIGELNYTVYNSKVVPADYKLNTQNNSQTLSLITCHPIGSTSQRLIYEANLTKQGPINNSILKENPQKNNGLYILFGFLIFGIVIGLIQEKSERKYVLVTVIIIWIFLLYCYLEPGLVKQFISQIEFLNQIFTLGG